jgi:hypothetical protein
MKLKLFFLFLIVSVTGCAQNAGIGTASPDSSAALDITSTGKGILIPRMSAAERTAIATPAKGLMVNDSTLKKFYYYDTVWMAIDSR